MKKTLLIAFLLMFGLVIQAQAASTNANQGNKTGQENSQGNQNGNTVQVQEKNQVQNQGEETQVQTQEQNTVQTKDKNENKKQDNAEVHRSAVANFVQNLLSVADREGGIGQEVRVIAQQQNDMKDRAADLIYAVENRNKVKTFFIGTSYRNVGELRSQMVQTRNQVEQLKRLIEKTTNEQDKTELQNQIQTMEQEQARINDFITQNESKFSLFGWAVKMFR
ncbi:MAG TPA: hypothetical protein P5548_01405 [Candidatus Moranbacteria bacterium]|nr:hypothetical protein [Candidatus Moranbacteria bacterium]HRZ33546.1 hypothetical protein [Candidatus Moranbacteria bacterium]